MQTVTAPTTNAEPQRLLNARQAAQMLGMGASTFQRQRALGVIGPEPVRIGGSVRWDRVAMEQWIDAGCPDADDWKAINQARHVRTYSKDTLSIVSKRG